jgi:hypothetical protein
MIGDRHGVSNRKRNRTLDKEKAPQLKKKAQ